jgi:hypothetical protein
LKDFIQEVIHKVWHLIGILFIKCHGAQITVRSVIAHKTNCVGRFHRVLPYGSSRVPLVDSSFQGRHSRNH